MHAHTHTHTHASLAGITDLQTQPSKVGVLEFQRDHTSHSPDDPYAHLDRVLYFVRVLTVALVQRTRCWKLQVFSFSPEERLWKHLGAPLQ